MGTRKSLNGRKNIYKFSGTNQKPERRRPFGTGLVRHCPQGFFSPFFTFLRAIYFSARLDFSSSPLSAPGSPRMILETRLRGEICPCDVTCLRAILRESLIKGIEEKLPNPNCSS